jgi:hypothetical protein
MNKLHYVGILLVLFAVGSCERLHWPPYENDLREMFSQSLPTLSQIENEMISDGLPIIGSGLNRAWSREDIPELTEAQTDKYASLFGKLPYYANIHRWDSKTHVKLMAQEARFRDFQFAFVHDDVPERLPSCDVASSFADCGECFVVLNPNWYLEYRWSNGDGIPSPDGCIDPDSLDFSE